MPLYGCLDGRMGGWVGGWMDDTSGSQWVSPSPPFLSALPLLETPLPTPFLLPPNPAWVVLAVPPSKKAPVVESGDREGE